jgi:MFS family permease
MQRVSLGAIIVPMAIEMGWDASQQSFIMSSFFTGYLMMQIPGGMLAQRVGAKVVLAASVAGGAICFGLVPFANAIDQVNGGLTMQTMCLFLKGIFHGPVIPSVTLLFSKWVPVAEQPQAQGLQGIMITACVAGTSLVTPYINDSFGWRFAFYTYAGISLVAVMLWQLLGDEGPTTSISISKEEKDMLRKTVSLKETEQKPGCSSSKAAAPLFPWFLLKSTAVWAAIIANFISNYGLYMFKNWGPTIYQELHGLGAKQAGAFLASQDTFATFANLLIPGIITAIAKARAMLIFLHDTPLTSTHRYSCVRCEQGCDSRTTTERLHRGCVYFGGSV